MRDRVFAGIGVVLVLLAIWYWFIHEPSDPFAPPPKGDVLADPKVPPEPEQKVEPMPDEPRADERRDDVPVRKVQPSCPPGDPMCGGL